MSPSKNNHVGGGGPVMSKWGGGGRPAMSGQQNV